LVLEQGQKLYPDIPDTRTQFHTER
jgi:hypothetical protein